MSVRAEWQSDRIIRGAVLTVSDTRTTETDKGGSLVRALAEQSGLVIADSRICKDHVPDIQEEVSGWLQQEDIDYIITTGGTGIAERDVTIEAVKPLLSKEMPGFGELFRWLSYTEDVGTRAITSRALAGTSSGKAMFVLPGSTGAVRLAMTRLIIPELPHLIHELRKHKA